jgi:hypothetical protein
MLMPTIAYFYGIAIRMYFVDHPPPHFFASYSGHEANVLIETGEVIHGHLPGNAAPCKAMGTGASRRIGG